MISVIVPIFNAEKWLKRCIDSIIMQKNVDLELLLIDDGSVDNSAEICLTYANQYENVYYYYKKNGGVSDTRNYGIQMAKGDWLVFVDSDDYLSEGILFKALESAENNPNKLVIWNAAYVVGDKINYSPDLYGNKITKEDIIASLMYESFGDFFLGFYFRAVWGKLICRNIVMEKDIRFDTCLYLGEDAKFMLQYVENIDGVTILNECGYNYFIQSDSAVHRYKQDLLEQSFRQLEEIKRISSCYEDSYAIQCALNSFLWGTFNALISNSMRKKSKHKPFEDAKIWYRQNLSLLQKNKGSLNRMSKFLKIEMLCSHFLPISFICFLAVLYEKKKFR